MMRLSMVLWLVTALGVSALLYHVSYEVKGLNDELNTVNREIVREQETIRVLNAEWAYLTQPARLRHQVQRLTDLTPVAPGQMMADATMVPAPLPDLGGGLIARPLPDLPMFTNLPLPTRRPNEQPGAPIRSAEPALIARQDTPAAPDATHETTRPQAQAAVATSTPPTLRPDALTSAAADPVGMLLASFRTGGEQTPLGEGQ